MGGMIRYVLEALRTSRAQYNTTYLAQYTNAALIVNEAYEGPRDPAHGGLFSGYRENRDVTPGKLGSYDNSTWKYANPRRPVADRAVVENTWKEWTDLDPRCVLRLLWEHFSTYTPDRVEEVTGCSREVFLEVCRTFAATGRPDRAGTILYAMGATQHTYGTQNIRAYAVLQLLLGNLAWPVEASTPCGERQTFRGPQTWRSCATSCPATFRWWCPQTRAFRTTLTGPRRPGNRSCPRDWPPTEAPVGGGGTRQIPTTGSI